MSNVMKMTLIVGGVSMLGYATMKLLTPNKEKMMEILSDDLKSEEKLKEVQKRNELVFAAMQRSAKSNDPIWKVDKELFNSTKYK
nr:assembly factor CBP4 [Hydra vulgaris]